MIKLSYLSLIYRNFEVWVIFFVLEKKVKESCVLSYHIVQKQVHRILFIYLYKPAKFWTRPKETKQIKINLLHCSAEIDSELASSWSRRLGGAALAREAAKVKTMRRWVVDRRRDNVSISRPLLRPSTAVLPVFLDPRRILIS